ncbi:DUF3732 domain-containing protein [Orenia marismortui]|uniref:Uncharacterized protein DUF3732 n=1 Tax=Orenia marismortui TaxID=46469 RepID=A0A4V3GWL3_9FIRM|nr:DUF3732 domain-containing protein [Orenia marismortui]TDX44479.1 uncharacterized protein DUF3732 [Orenia marismortui]
MQILEIVLYSYSGKKRVVPLQSNSVNVITGGSGTGKTALIDIIDYCLGKGECMISEGVILKKVAWFGLLLKFGDEKLFIARENPGLKKKTTNRSYIEQGVEVSSPDNISEPNTNIEAITETLNNKIGISPNLNIPPEEQTRNPLSANIRHALFYCFQHQTEVATNQYLFHRQSEDYITQTIKDTLPYFLGAVQEDRLALEQELKRAKRGLSKAKNKLNNIKAIQGKDLSKAIGLLSEAKELELAEQRKNPNDFKEFVEVFEKIINWTPDKINTPNSERIIILQSELKELKDNLNEKQESIMAAKTFAREASGFMREVSEQKFRLESIGLFNYSEHNSELCPVCSQNIKESIPNANLLEKSIKKLDSSLKSVTKERPKLREYIEALEEKSEVIKELIKKKNEEINGVLKTKEDANKLRNLNVQRGKVIGRISLWLESVNLTDDLSGLKEEVRIAKKKVEELEKNLDIEKVEEKINSILNRMGIQMTKWSESLKLEHSENPIRFDIKKATVIVDMENRFVPLRKIGSAENWVGYHIISHLALHKHFARHSRPVPRFLFLDQPSQVYYPREKDSELRGSLDGLNDEDRKAVYRLYNFIFDFIEDYVPEFQIIVTDHADLVDDRFQSSVVERWRDNNALIPENWINDQSS